MFGLSIREQRWAAEQRAAELLTEIVIAALANDAKIDAAKYAAEIQSLKSELQEIRKLLVGKEVNE